MKTNTKSEWTSMEKQYQTQTITETIEVGASAYTKALAQSMQNTKDSLLRQLLDAATISNLPFGYKSYEIKVDFNDSNS